MGQGEVPAPWRTANGRVAGDPEGATTSYGVLRTATSVVDYVIVPAAYLTQVRGLIVSEEPLDDHSSLTLVLEGEAGPPARPAPPTIDLCLMRFPRPRDPERVDAAVAELTASAMLPPILEAAQRASTPAEVAAVAQQRCIMIAAACQGAGVRQASTAGSGGRGAGSVSSLPGHIARRFHLRELRAALRQARRQQGSPEHVAARRQLQRATRQARQAHRDERAERLEGQFLTEHDAAGFHQAYRGPRAELPDWVLREPEALFEHFRDLLDTPPPSPPPTRTQTCPQPPRTDPQEMRAGGQGRHGKSRGSTPMDGRTPITPQASSYTTRRRRGRWRRATAAGTPATVPLATPFAHQPVPSPSPSPVHAHAALRARMDAPFTAEEILELAGRTPLRMHKSVIGPLAPWLLKPACQHLAPVIAAEFNAPTLKSLLLTPSTTSSPLRRALGFLNTWQQPAPTATACLATC